MEPGDADYPRRVGALKIGVVATAASVPAVIRFHCPSCDRPYALPDALAHLPLVCKGCGERLNVPDSSADPEPESEPPGAKVEAPPPTKELPADPASPSPPPEVVPNPEITPAAAPAPGNRRVLGLAADGAVALVLAGGGALLGELATRRSTAAVFRTADPLELAAWAGCVAVPVLVHLLLANRGKSLGGWLRRRAG